MFEEIVYPMEAVIEQVSEYERERGKPMPTLNHAAVQGNLIFSLKLQYRQQYTILSELNLSMPERPDTVPDIAVYPKLTIDFFNDITSMTQMPLTVIEIISPSQSNEDILSKFKRYFDAGVKSCWLVIPSFQAISVYSEFGKYRFFSENDTLTDAATGIEIALNDIFA
jgi:Uma2 family endonuclease